MAHHGYPRIGLRLAPSVLEPFLRTRIPKGLRGTGPCPERFHQLDESAWSTLGNSRCFALAAWILRRISTLIANSDAALINTRILNSSNELTTLPTSLNKRMLNAMRRAGFDKSPMKLNQTSVGDLLRIRGVGTKSIMDTLVMLQEYIERPDSQLSLSGALHATSKYPRPGHPLAPRALASVLQKRIRRPLREKLNGEFDYLADLDSSVWDKTDEKTLSRLSDAIIVRVQSALQVQRPRLLEQVIPRLPNGLTWREIPLDTRTLNCLTEFPSIGTELQNGTATVRTLLTLPSFGAKSLLSLVTSIEHAIDSQRKEPVSPRLMADAATRLAALAAFGECAPQDPRVGDILREIDANSPTLSEAAKHFTERSLSSEEHSQILRSIDCLESTFKQLAKIPLHEEVLGILAHRMSPRDRNVLTARLGMGGKPSAILEEIGEEFGITRERIRQICNKANTGTEVIFAPVLSEVLADLKRMLPATAPEFQKAINAHSRVALPLALHDLGDVATRINQVAPWKLVNGSASPLVVLCSDEMKAQKANIEAQRLVKKYGLATLVDVAAAASAATNEKGISAIRSLIGAHPDVVWLDSECDWFTFRQILDLSMEAHGLFLALRKILSVAPRVHLSELRRAIARNRRIRPMVPPRNVLAHLCGLLQFCRINGEDLETTTTFDAEGHLSDGEGLIVEILRTEGPLLSTSTLARKCFAKGMSAPAFGLYTSCSTVIARYANGVYGVVGTEVLPGMVEAVEREDSEHGLLNDFGWTSDGNLWICYELTSASVRSCVLTIPSSLKQFLSGKYSATTIDGTPVGTIGIDGPSAWGVGPFLRRCGAEEHDWLGICFDLKSRSAVLTIGDADLKQEMAEA